MTGKRAKIWHVNTSSCETSSPTWTRVAGFVRKRCFGRSLVNTLISVSTKPAAAHYGRVVASKALF
jgi:hypothetical protein